MKNHSFIIASLLLLTAGSCRPRLNYPADTPNNNNLNSLLILEAGKNIIRLQDYIMKPSMMDSVIADSKHVTIRLSTDKHKAEVEVDKDAENFIDMQIWVKGVPFSIPCCKSNPMDCVFTFDPKEKRYDTVRIAGQMNDWNPLATPPLTLKSSGLYQITLKLNSGTYLYQLVLDGNRTHDPNNALKIENGQGGYSSIMQVAEDGEKTPLIFMHEFSDNMITLSCENRIDDVFIYWQNYKIPAVFSKMTEDKIIFDIPAEAKSVERSFIRVWASNPSGISNGLLIPLHNGKVSTEPED
ncbi:MAG: hypothetical protein LBH80_03930 [Prevotellaceae bacterium]|jgi:hypothetical protein|nr:hypothetical protein [Prevotellaceae bacterium]